MPADPDMMADLLWLQVCYYFGDQANTGGDFERLDEYLELATNLAPKWPVPYYFAAIVLPMATGSVDTGMKFLDTAILHHPNTWQFPFFKGMYLMMHKNDLLGAGENLHQAALLPGSPKYLANLSASLASKIGKRRLAYLYLQEALATTDDPAQKEIITKKFKELFKGEAPVEME